MGLRRVIVLACALGAALSVSAPAFALTRTQADAIARSVLKPPSGGDVALLGLPAALPIGTAVSEAGPGPGERWTVVTGSGGSKLTASVPRTVLSRTGWLFWEDPQSGASFPHESRLLLVDDRTGHVAWQKTIDWWPLLDDRPATPTPTRTGRPTEWRRPQPLQRGFPASSTTVRSRSST